ncbi:hypothetical protein LWI28_000624 [Acer negundo]|uniref:Uncharacterized protein n=1 Tax=Acer negundo TaxID=4023 RepID=A0AAD5ITB4_ACENE|nr:hypothetical protein LWI28_000624 [Acer negundo]
MNRRRRLEEEELKKTKKKKKKKEKEEKEIKEEEEKEIEEEEIEEEKEKEEEEEESGVRDQIRNLARAKNPNLVGSFCFVQRRERELHELSDGRAIEEFKFSNHNLK